MHVFRALPVFVVVGGVLLLASHAWAQSDVIVDNADAEFAVLAGSWNTGTTAPGHWGSDYRWVGTETGAADAEVEWRPDLPAAGYYEVAIYFPQGGNRAADAAFTVHHTGGSDTLTLSQQVDGGFWRPLGLYAFDAGSDGRVTLSNVSEVAGDVVIADAVRFRPVSFAPSERRALWASRFEWPSSDPDTMKANLRRVLDRAVRGGFNTVLLQVRGQADTIYPSPEPFSPTIGATDPGFDVLEMAIREAHARGLELHAYFNTHVFWGGTGQPSDPSHIYYDHANPNDANARDWLITDTSENYGVVDGYLWMAPGHPDAQAYVRAQVMYLVENYPELDGIHFDRIRTPGPAYSHDATSNARRAGPGNPHSLGFADWTREQFTRFLIDVYGEVREVHPHIQHSATPLGLYQQDSYPGYPSYFLYGRTQCYQDAQAWLEAQALDWIAPQIYWADDGSEPNFSEVLPDWLANTHGRHVYPGMNATSNVTRTINEVDVARNQGAPGHVYWSYGTAAANDHWDALFDDAFGGYAQAPALPWIDAPDTAIIVGTVTDAATQQPVTDAWITLDGSAWVAVSSGDGFFSIVGVEPGTASLTVEHPSLGSQHIAFGNLGPGEVARADVALNPAAEPATQLVILEVTPTSPRAESSFSVTVEVQDATGERVELGGYAVELVLDEGNGTQTGTTSGVTTDGLVTIEGVRYDRAETITLAATNPPSFLSAGTVELTLREPASSSGCALGGHVVPSLAWLILALIMMRAHRQRRRSAQPETVPGTSNSLG